MRFVSGPCSETQPARTSSDKGRGKGARALMEARGRYPVRRAAGPMRADGGAAGRAWRPGRFVTEVTNGTVSQTPRPGTSPPGFEHGVLCCLRPGGGCTGGPAPDHTRCTPPPAVPPKEERNGEGYKSPDGRG